MQAGEGGWMRGLSDLDCSCRTGIAFRVRMRGRDVPENKAGMHMFAFANGPEASPRVTDDSVSFSQCIRPV
jgi:hypothetical protein